jgi:hypothetical protein
MPVSPATVQMFVDSPALSASMTRPMISPRSSIERLVVPNVAPAMFWPMSRRSRRHCTPAAEIGMLPSWAFLVLSLPTHGP